MGWPGRPFADGIGLMSLPVWDSKRAIWTLATRGLLDSPIGEGMFAIPLPAAGGLPMRTILESTLPAPAHIADVQQRSDEDDALFRELADVMKKHNALDRFGITLLHRHFDIQQGEVLLETTDVPSRVQTIEPVKEETLAGMPYVETSWRLGDGWVAMACVCVKYGDDHSHQSRG